MKDRSQACGVAPLPCYQHSDNHAVILAHPTPRARLQTCWRWAIPADASQTLWCSAPLAGSVHRKGTDAHHPSSLLKASYGYLPAQSQERSSWWQWRNQPQEHSTLRDRALPTLLKIRTRLHVNKPRAQLTAKRYQGKWNSAHSAFTKKGFIHCCNYLSEFKINLFSHC